MPRYLTASSFLATSSLNVQEVLSNKRYRVPDFQREFKWGNTQFDQLWDDINGLYTTNVNNGAIIQAPRPHFLGSIVIQAPAPVITMDPRFEVIDGQQRLTTLSCIVSVLLEFAEQVVDPTSKRMLTGTLNGMLGVFSGGSLDPILRLGREDDFFQESAVLRTVQASRVTYWNAQNITKRPTAQRIRKCLEFFYTKIQGFVAPNNALDEQILSTLISIVGEFLVLMEVVVQDHKMAYHLFEALNFRGLALSQADLIKNELLKRASSNGTYAPVAALWTNILDNIANQDRISLPDFIQLHFLSNYGPAKATDLFETVTARLDNTNLTPIVYAQSLANESKLLVDLVNGRPSWQNNANRALEDVKKPLGVNMVYPLLLAAAVRFVNNDADFAKMANITRNFAFRFFKVQDSSLSQLIRVIGEAARILRDTSRPPAEAVDILRNASPDPVFVAEMGSASFSPAALGFFAIAQIEEHIAAGSGMLVNRQSPAQHLEHILPQTHTVPSWAHVPPADAELNLWRLGNLTVLEANINSYIKNKSFAEKNSNTANKDYQNSGLGLPRDIHTYLDNGQWTVKSIEDRQAVLVTTYAALTWPLVW